MRKLATLSALAVALGALAPLAAMANEAPTIPAAVPVVTPGTRFDIVDRQTGRVIGELVAVGTAGQSIRSIGSVRAQVAQPADTQTKWIPRHQESAAFWEEFNSRVIGPSSP